MRRKTNIGKLKMITRFDDLMEKVTSLDKRWWIGLFFVVAIVANYFGFG